MNWDDLRIFLAITRTGSISGAARKLDVQHSTVSRRLQQLEKKLAVRLFDKKRSGYEITAAGENLKLAAERMEREVLGLDSSLLSSDQNISGTLRVATVNNIASSFLMPILASFKKLYPHIYLQVTVSNTDISLAQRDADVAIRITNSPTETLIGKRIALLASTAYTSRSYLKSLKKHASTPQWIGANCCTYHKHWTKTLSKDHDSHFHVDDAILTQQAIRQDLGIGILPCYLGDTDSNLCRYSDPIDDMDLELWFLVHPDLNNTARVKVFRDYIAEEVGKISGFLHGEGVSV